MVGNHDTNVFFGALDNSENKAKTIFRMFLSIIVFTGLSLGLYFLRYNIPWGPSFVSTDFSVFFELIASIAYGPIIGTIICLLKFIFAIIIRPTSMISCISNFVIETAFIVTASVYYYKKKYKNAEREGGKVRQYRRKRIITGSFLGMVPALIIQAFSSYFFVFPMLERLYSSKGYTKAFFIQDYQNAVDAITQRFPGLFGKLLPEMTNLWQGILIFNTPATFLKFLSVALITALIYPVISPYLHFNLRARR